MPYLGRTVVTNLADFHVDNYSASGDFTAGSTTALTLSITGIDDEDALSVFFDGVHQHHNTYTIANSVVTFDTAIPTGTANVEIHYGKQPVASALAANVIDSEHYVDGSIDLSHMSSQSVDEDNLHISNSGSNGQFLSKQSGDAGGLTWAAAGGGLQSVQVFTSSGTWTDPGGLSRVIVEVVGGGGGGGGTNNSGSDNVSAGGGGGGYAIELIETSATGGTETVTIGALGAGGASGSSSAGNTGGTSSFGSLVSATGGVGAPSGAKPKLGGLGGAGSGGTVNTTGSPGDSRTGDNNTVSAGGAAGGDSKWGSGAGGPVDSNTNQSATGYGGGGGGAVANTAAKAGGDGTAGIVIVWEYA
jgi:hypothetical protein